MNDKTIDFALNHGSKVLWAFWGVLVAKTAKDLHGYWGVKTVKK